VIEDEADRPAWHLDVPDSGPLEPEMPETEPVTPPSPKRIIEAFLFVGGLPLTAERAADAIRGLNAGQFQEAIASLNQDYRRQGRPYSIQPRDHGFVLTLRPPFRSVVEKIFGGPREARLSPQVVDALALVAYRQPATKQEIDTIRGGESGPLLRQLVRRGLIAVVNRGDAQQKQVAYGTTPRFLEVFGLKSLEELPQTQDLQKL
jgi:segregation and condensation protein B